MIRIANKAAQPALTALLAVLALGVRGGGRAVLAVRGSDHSGGR